MTKGDTTENDLLEYVFKKTAFSWDAVTNLEVHLHTADPTDAGTTASNECVYTNYAEVTVTRDAAGWTVTTDTAANAGIIAFPQCGAVGEVITHVSIAPSGTTQILYHGELNDSLTVANLIQPQFQIGALTITED